MAKHSEWALAERLEEAISANDQSEIARLFGSWLADNESKLRGLIYNRSKGVSEDDRRALYQDIMRWAYETLVQQAGLTEGGHRIKFLPRQYCKPVDPPVWKWLSPLAALVIRDHSRGEIRRKKHFQYENEAAEQPHSVHRPGGSSQPMSRGPDEETDVSRAISRVRAAIESYSHPNPKLRRRRKRLLEILLNDYKIPREELMAILTKYVGYKVKKDTLKKDIYEVSQYLREELEPLRGWTS